MAGKTRKQVHARVFTGELKPGQIEDAARVLQREILPKLRKHKGFRGHKLLLNGNKFSWMTSWISCPGPGVIVGWARPMTPYVRGPIQNVRYTIGMPRLAKAKRTTVRRVRPAAKKK